MSIKIDKQKLEKLNFKNNKIFGSWINNLEQLNKNFINAQPYEHIVIDNFLNDEYISNIEKEFPENYEDWFKYNNPLEVKYAYDNIGNLKKNTECLFYILSSPQVINLFRKITGINNLNYDEYLHGAGIHAHQRNGKLAIHLDYEKHPISGKERRLNLILYLNKKWKEEWLGSTESRYNRMYF